MPCNTTFGNYIAGQRINHWTLLESPKNKRHRIFCRCDCGVEKIVKAEQVLVGTSKQCRACGYIGLNVKHGGSVRGRRTRLNSIWSGMLSRCSSPKHEYAYLYFARGIRVCDEWRSSFVAFRDWALTNGYADHLTLDRKDNNRGYSPDNCRWVTTQQQQRNQRNRTYLSAFGESKLLIEWAEDPRCAVNYATLRCRLLRGWPLEKSILLPRILSNRWP